MFIYSLFIFILNLCRKSSSWHTSLRIRKKSERKDKEAKKDTKLENGYRKSRDGLANKVSVKVRVWTNVDERQSILYHFTLQPSLMLSIALFQLLNPNYIYDGTYQERISPKLFTSSTVSDDF